MACASPDCKSGPYVVNNVGSTPTSPTIYHRTVCPPCGSRCKTNPWRLWSQSTVGTVCRCSSVGRAHPSYGYGHWFKSSFRHHFVAGWRSRISFGSYPKDRRCNSDSRFQNIVSQRLDHLHSRFTVTKRVWWYCVARFALANYILFCRLS